MSTITATPPRSSSAARVSLPRVVNAEWLKLRTVPSTMWTLLSGAGVTILLAMLFSALAGDTVVAAGGPPGGSLATDAVSTALGGTTITQLFAGVVGVLAVAGEYSTGMIRTTIAAVGKRGWIVSAKAAVVGVGTFLIMGLGVGLAVVVGQALYTGSAATLALTDPVLLQAVLGTTVYLTGVALIGVALGFILRSTASAIATLVVGLMIGPPLFSLLPESITDLILPYLPSEAGSILMSTTTAPDAMSWGAALGVLLAWVVGLLATAWFLLHRRDA